MDTFVNTLQPDRNGSSRPMSHPVDPSHRQSLSALRDSVPPDTDNTWAPAGVYGLDHPRSWSQFTQAPQPNPGPRFTALRRRIV